MNLHSATQGLGPNSVGSAKLAKYAQSVDGVASALSDTPVGSEFDAEELQGLET